MAGGTQDQSKNIIRIRIELVNSQHISQKAAYKIKQTNQVVPGHGLDPELVVEEAGEFHCI